MAYDVYVDVLTEFGRNARVGTFLIRVFRESADATDMAHRAAERPDDGARPVSALPQPRTSSTRIANLALSAEDFELRVPSGVGVRRRNRRRRHRHRHSRPRRDDLLADAGGRKRTGQDLQRRRRASRAASTRCTCARTLPSSIAGSTSARFMRATSIRAICGAPKRCFRKICRGRSASSSPTSAATDGRSSRSSAISSPR